MTGKRAASGAESITLPEHLYTRGFLGGRHSDITIIAFGQRYALHRLILDRAPFFANGLSEPWVEATAKEVPLHPEELDSNITKFSFELTLKKLYGVDISQEEDKEAIGLFATGCWLEMQDLVDSAIESILRQMAPENLAGLIRLVTNNYYGKSGERILASAKAMLCRDGWEMPLKYWDNIPADVVKEVVGGDGFFVPGEWDRWVLAKRLLDRRLRHKAVEVGLMNPFDKKRPRAPDSVGFTTLRNDPKYRKEFLESSISAFQLTEEQHLWASLYMHPEVEPILTLLEQGIHYLHLDFEQLMFIRQARDGFGLPVLSDRVVTDAQWMQLELRCKVLSARDGEMELGLSTSIEDLPEHVNVLTEKGFLKEKEANAGDATPILSPPIPSRKSSYKGKQKAIEDAFASAADSQLTGKASLSTSVPSSNPSSVPYRFPIPSQDCNIVMGGNADPVITTSSSYSRHATQLSSDTTDLQFATEFPSSPTDNRPTTPRSLDDKSAPPAQPRPTAYSSYPPFRFAAEFPNPRSLKEKKRVYSRTVFYAGSLWNVYIQKVRSAKNPQLGVYLHRAKEREVEDGVISGVGAGNTSANMGALSNAFGAYPGLGGRAGTVDEQIGLLEREMLLRSERRERRHARAAGSTATGHRNIQSQPLDMSATRHNGDESSGSGAEADTAAQTSSSARLASHGRRRERRVYSFGGEHWSFPQTNPSSPSESDADDSDDNDDDDVFNTFSAIPPLVQPAQTVASNPSPPTTRRPRKLMVRSASGNATATTTTAPRDNRPDSALGRPGITRMPTLPPYVDARPTIRTWFKIYSPSKGGRLLSVYESAPDRFNFSQSWGWKSGSLMLDEGFDTSGNSANVPNMEANVDLGPDGDTLGLASGQVNEADLGLEHKESREGRRKKWRAKGEGKLRFMIVIGNL